MGDYGTRDGNQAAVAQGLARLAGEKAPQAISAIGDNVYPDGAAYDPWTITRWWGEVYLGHQTLRRPWHVITGNHDWWTDALVERAYTGSEVNMNRGVPAPLPHFWYKKTYSAGGLSVDAFYIDTMIWKGGTLTEKHMGPQAKEEQKQWLFSELANSQADWKVVLGHHGIYSAGMHGVTEVLLSELDPKLRELGVPVYFAGHDHSKQVIVWEGMTYVVSGAGGATSRGLSNQYPQGSLKHLFTDHGFVGMTVCNKTDALITIYSPAGDVQATWPLKNAPKQRSLRIPAQPWTPLESKSAIHRAAVCNGVQLKSVEKWCSRDGCKVLADSSQSCSVFCKDQALQCQKAWIQHPEEEDCTEADSVPCALPATNSSLICECGALPDFLP
eukprot:Skav202543  [mRNA]  locus=scaffold2011:263193:264350:- [translate_table: standard]